MAKRIPRKIPELGYGMKCCRYCHHYDNGRCYNTSVGSNFEENVAYGEWFNHVCEDGKVQEILDETLHQEEMFRSFFDDVTKLAIKKGMRSSAKSLKEFKDALKDCYDIFVSDVLPYLDGALNDGLDSYECGWERSDSDDGFIVSNPESFCCANYL